MKYLKKFSENYNDDLIDSFGEIGSQISRLKSLVNQHIKKITPKEIYEDYFLELKEIEGFKIYFSNHANITIEFRLENMIDKDKIESETERFIRKMKGVVARLERKFGSSCHFVIYLNGKPQCVQTSYNRKEDDIKFTGIGDELNGSDKDDSYGKYGNKPFPDDKVAMKIIFFMA